MGERNKAESLRILLKQTGIKVLLLTGWDGKDYEEDLLHTEVKERYFRNVDLLKAFDCVIYT